MGGSVIHRLWSTTLHSVMLNSSMASAELSDTLTQSWLSSSIVPLVDDGKVKACPTKGSLGSRRGEFAKKK